MEVAKYKRKLKLLFDKFFQKNFELCTYYSDNLLKYLDDCPDKKAEQILETPFFSDLILYSLSNVENASSSVRVFFMKVIAIILKNELQFSKLVQLRGFEMMAVKLCALDREDPKPDLHLASINLAFSTVLHYSGLQWNVYHKVWKYIMRPRINHRTASVSRAAYKFTSKLVWKLNDYDEEAALAEILAFILQPIRELKLDNIKIIDTDTMKDLFDPLTANLKTLLVVLSETDQILKPNKVITLLYKQFIIEQSLEVLLQLTRDFEFASLLSQINYRFGFGINIDVNNKYGSDTAMDLTTTYYNILNSFVNKRMMANALDFIVNCIKFWSQIDTSVVSTIFERHERKFDIRIQFLVGLLAAPITYAYLVNAARKNEAQILALDNYFIKTSCLATEHIISLGYSLRHLIEGGDSKKMTIMTLREILRLRGYLNMEQASLMYPPMYYVLQLFVLSDGRGGLYVDENLLKSPDDAKLLSLVLEVIKMLLKEHTINWYESVEIVSLQTCLMNLLKQNVLPTKQLIQAVDLIDLSIKKSLSPDLALLIESRKGSSLNEIGVMMTSYMQHEEWEVRDSAVSLLLSCTEVAFISEYQI